MSKHTDYKWTWSPYKHREFNEDEHVISEPDPLGGSMVSIDWLGITIFSDAPMGSSMSPTDVDKKVMSILNITDYKYANAGGRNYRFRFNCSYGINYYTSPSLIQKNGYHSHFELQGSALDAVSVMSLYELFEYLRDNEILYNITRLDVACDHTYFDPEDCWEAVRLKNIKTRAHRRNITWITDADSEGATLYVGSAESDARLRIYRKLDDPDNPVFLGDYTRVELQARNKHALYIWLNLMNLHFEIWTQRCVEFINGFCEFQFPEWQNMIDPEKDFEKQWVKIKHKKPTFQSVHNWLVTQVAPTLSAWFDSWGVVDHGNTRHGEQSEFYPLLELNNLIDHGRDKWNDKHVQIMQSFHSDMQTVLGTSEYDMLHEFQDVFIKRHEDTQGVMGRKHAWQKIRTVGIQKLFDTYAPMYDELSSVTL